MKTAALLFAAAALLLAGTADYQEAERAEEHYRDMVCAGHWPNYEKREVDCG